MSENDFQMQPAEVVDITRRLDDLATRVQALIDTERPNLSPAAAGHDEVSGRVAQTLGAVSVAFGKSTDQGLTELREVAATLRSHTDHVVDAESDFVL
ncbi:PE family protein [Mycobacterium sp. 3519A]|uniref:PE family protein n=1 Tax=Mycobacterium sp. 3519A TaxID=2057184 RepID=UPI001F451794|nr:PE family protein [Mycobacterium sp. 3519A]